MSKRFFILFLVCCITFHLSAAPTTSTPADQAYLHLIRQSARNLNICDSAPEDSIISLCHKVEALGREAKNKTYIFKAGQLQVNAYAQAGALGLAANKAQNLLDEATREQDPVGMGLAIQAIGSTYMYTNRYAQADSVFLEAEVLIKHGDETLQIQLAMQQLYVYFSMQDTTKLGTGIRKVRKIVSQSTLPEKSDYIFLLDCYQGFRALQSGDTNRAYEVLQHLKQEKHPTKVRNMWLDYLTAHYYESVGIYNMALECVDSILQKALLSSNKDLQRETLFYKASLLEKTGKAYEACDIYQIINKQTDSLSKNNYLAQIDSLHVTYWVDHLEMENITRRNSSYAKIISGLLLLVIGSIALVIYIRRNNLKLNESRRKLEAMRRASADSIHSKSLFLSNMSHELRTPLNAIMGFSTILTEKEETDSETLQYGAYIRHNADLLMKLINDVTDFSDLKNDSIRFSFAPCDVVPLCNNVLKTIQNVKRTEAQLSFETDLDKLVIVSDHTRIQQVLINLLINATKFTKTGSIILRLGLSDSGKDAVFSVEDTGCGIPLEQQPKIFDRFEKFHEGVQGAGLGLSICKLIIDRIGGKIWVDPTYTQGARFIFTHPLHTPDAL